MSSHASRHAEEYGGPLRWSAVLTALLVAAVLALPWLVPALPRLLTDLVPAPVPAPRAGVVQDPVVLPPSTTGPLVPRRVSPGTRSLEGLRLPAAGMPVRLSVERLSVRSAVVPISGESGALLPPSDAQVLGWWQEGAVPGAARGTAVLTGHTVHTGGGAFDHLARLVPGDRVRVRTDVGSLAYAVRSVRDYRTDALARHSSELFRLGGPGRLVLVTCSDWNGTLYLSNTVVVAEPVAATGGRAATVAQQAFL